MLNCNIFYESWQLDCCGDPFKIGDSVSWIVEKCDKIETMVEIDKIDYVYEAHSDEWTRLSVFDGTVSRIQILYEKFEPEKENSTSMQRVKGGRLVDVHESKKWEANLEGLYPVGFVVTFDSHNIRPASKEDISFCQNR